MLGDLNAKLLSAIPNRLNQFGILHFGKVTRASNLDSLHWFALKPIGNHLHSPRLAIYGFVNQLLCDGPKFAFA